MKWTKIIKAEETEKTDNKKVNMNPVYKEEIKNLKEAQKILTSIFEDMQKYIENPKRVLDPQYGNYAVKLTQKLKQIQNNLNIVLADVSNSIK